MTTELVVAFDEYSGLYGFENPTLYGGTLQYNEDIIVKGAKYLTTTQKPKNVIFRKEKNEVSHYSDEKTNVMSVTDYINNISLLAGKAFDCDEDGHNFKDIEDEIRYKRFSNDWKPVYEKKFEETVLDIVIIKKPVSAYPEIVPISGLSDITSTKKCLCEFSPDSCGYLKTICEGKGVTYELGGLHKDEFNYSKVLGNFLFYSSEPKFPIVRQGTYEQCIESRNAWIKHIEKRVDSIILKKFPEKVKLNGCTVKLINELLDMIPTVRKLDVKKADYLTLNILCSQLEEKRSQVLEMLMETNKELLLCVPTK